jgi:malate/lactate dehydrogenase
MQDVAIVGAGELGGNLAHVLAGRDVVRSIRLIDSAGNVAAGKAPSSSNAATRRISWLRCSKDL